MVTPEGSIEDAIGSDRRYCLHMLMFILLGLTIELTNTANMYRSHIGCMNDNSWTANDPTENVLHSSVSTGASGVGQYA